MPSTVVSGSGNVIELPLDTPGYEAWWRANPPLAYQRGDPYSQVPLNPLTREEAIAAGKGLSELGKTIDLPFLRMSGWGLGILAQQVPPPVPGPTPPPPPGEVIPFPGGPGGAADFPSFGRGLPVGELGSAIARLAGLFGLAIGDVWAIREVYRLGTKTAALKKARRDQLESEKALRKVEARLRAAERLREAELRADDAVKRSIENTRVQVPAAPLPTLPGTSSSTVPGPGPGVSPANQPAAQPFPPPAPPRGLPKSPTLPRTNPWPSSTTSFPPTPRVSSWPVELARWLPTPRAAPAPKPSPPRSLPGPGDWLPKPQPMPRIEPPSMARPELLGPRTSGVPDIESVPQEEPSKCQCRGGKKKRKKGQCEEGFFRETETGTTYNVWRRRSCGTAKGGKRAAAAALSAIAAFG